MLIPRFVFPVVKGCGKPKTTDRFAYGCVKVGHEDGIDYAQAYDGQIIVDVAWNPRLTDDYPSFGVEDFTGDWETLIPADAWTRAVKRVPKKGSSPDAEVLYLGYRNSDNRGRLLVLGSTDYDEMERLEIRQPLATYPDLEPLLSSETEKPEPLSGPVLAKVAGILEEITNPFEDGHFRVPIHQESGNHIVRFVAQHPPMIVRVAAATIGVADKEGVAF